MGTPVIEPPEYGADCPTCTPSLFAAGETPRFLKLTGADIEACPGAPHPAPNGEWILENHVTHTCAWYLFTSQYSFSYAFNPIANQTLCYIWTVAKYYFLHFSNPACQTVLANQYLICIGGDRYGKLGTVSITW